MQSFIENGEELRASTSIPDKIDTETEIGTSLKSEFYFRFH